MKVSELSGQKLREWVARAQGWKVELDVDSLICFADNGDVHSFGEFGYCPDMNWAQGGSIIERELMHVGSSGKYKGVQNWFVECSRKKDGQHLPYPYHGTGPTLLVAAMRAFVASKFGEEVPDEAKP